jgi:predicted transglutaminase-like cysteine proteinase
MLTEEQVKIVQRVHARVFKIFEYKTDKEQHGLIEHWHDPAMIKAALENGRLVGDCDDFVLTCRHLLWEQNVPNRLVLCADENGDGHLVLEAEGYILDNRQTKVRTIDELPYRWIKMSGYKAGDPWTEIAR